MAWAIIVSILFHGGLAVIALYFRDNSKTQIEDTTVEVTLLAVEATLSDPTVDPIRNSRPPEASRLSTPAWQKKIPPVAQSNSAPAPMVKEIMPAHSTEPSNDVKDEEIEQASLTSPTPAPALLSTAAPQTPAVSASNYANKLLGHLAQFLKYPTEARKRQEEGDVILSIEVGHDGELIAKRVQRSSGNKTLDAAALSTISRASPLPQPQTSPISIEVPIRYRLTPN